MRSEFGLEACMESVVWHIEKNGENPLTMLGTYTLRARQDVFFNKTMIDALLLYIEEHNIGWNDKF